MDHLSLISIVSVAFLNSFSHCYTMCGGLNIAFLRLNSNAKHPFFLSLIYHSFRILGYVFLGILASLFSLIFTFSSLSWGLFLFVLGCFMMLLGVALILRGKILENLEKLAFFSKFQSLILAKFSLKGVRGAVLLGLFNALMPCGLIYFFLASAMSSHSLLKAAFIMLIFGLSTLPALLFLSQIHSFLNENFKKALSVLSSVIIVVYGAYLAYLGLNLTR